MITMICFLRVLYSENAFFFYIKNTEKFHVAPLFRLKIEYTLCSNFSNPAVIFKQIMNTWKKRREEVSVFNKVF